MRSYFSLPSFCIWLADLSVYYTPHRPLLLPSWPFLFPNARGCLSLVLQGQQYGKWQKMRVMINAVTVTVVAVEFFLLGLCFFVLLGFFFVM